MSANSYPDSIVCFKYFVMNVQFKHIIKFRSHYLQHDTSARGTYASAFQVSNSRSEKFNIKLFWNALVKLKRVIVDTIFIFERISGFRVSCLEYE